MKREMRIKIAVAVLVPAFALSAVILSYARYGKKASENTSETADGRILVCRRYAQISKVIAVDPQKKSRKKEVTGWSYDAGTGELFVTESLPDFGAPYFHIEGRPSEPAEFILHDLDPESGPAAVFLNGRPCAENREYVLSAESRTLTLKVPPKDVSSVEVIWHTGAGLSSFSEMSRKEIDLYAGLKGAWFAENAKKEIMAQTESPVLEFAANQGGVPRVVMKKITDAERREMIDGLPVNTYKFRRDTGMRRLSREAGFRIRAPKKIAASRTDAAADARGGAYRMVSVLLIESSRKGEKTNSVEISYDRSDFFSPSSICVEISKLAADDSGDEIQYPVSSETLELKIPVKKQTFWTVAAENSPPAEAAAPSAQDGPAGGAGGLSYRAEQCCRYEWTAGGASYRISCGADRAKETEAFIAAML